MTTAGFYTGDRRPAGGGGGDRDAAASNTPDQLGRRNQVNPSNQAQYHRLSSNTSHDDQHNNLNSPNRIGKGAQPSFFQDDNNTHHFDNLSVQRRRGEHNNYRQQRGMISNSDDLANRNFSPGLERNEESCSDEESSEAMSAVASAEEYAAKIIKLQQACLIPLKEDLADWLNKILKTSNITTENFMDKLDNGVVICRLAKIISLWCEQQLSTPSTPNNVSICTRRSVCWSQDRRLSATC